MSMGLALDLCPGKDVMLVASANWMKATTQKAGAMKKHLGQKERETGNHSNLHIDRLLSSLNYSLGCSDYSEALERMKVRTKTVDQVHPPLRVRKDRVTCCFLEIPCPRELTESGRSDEFFKQVYEVMKAFFGPENVHGGFVHKDEVHDYVDEKGASRVSLEHLHGLVSAYTDEKGINGKAFETKARLRAFNQALEDMCVREFGIPFNTGEKPGRKSVERLKLETELRQEAASLSMEADWERQRRDNAAREAHQAESQRDAAKAEVWILERDRHAAEDALSEVETKKEQMQNEVDQLRNENNRLQSQARDAEQRLNRSQDILSRQQNITSESLGVTSGLTKNMVKMPRTSYDLLLKMAQAGIAAEQENQKSRGERRRMINETNWHRNEWAKLRDLSPSELQKAVADALTRGEKRGVIPPPLKETLREQLNQAQQKIGQSKTRAVKRPQEKDRSR